jgi:hypothetical protein
VWPIIFEETQSGYVWQIIAEPWSCSQQRCLTLAMGLIFWEVEDLHAHEFLELEDARADVLAARLHRSVRLACQYAGSVSSKRVVGSVWGLPISSSNLRNTTISQPAMLALYHSLSKEEIDTTLILGLDQLIAPPLSMST